MSGRTLRDAIAVALEVVPGPELAAGDERSRAALHHHLLTWIKEYAFNRGVIFDDDDLEQDLADVIAELRLLREGERPHVAVAIETERGVDPIRVPCRMCNAKPGERCSSMINASQLRDPHYARIELADLTPRSP